MSKRPKLDESGDSDDLQALFDSIASQPLVSASPAVAPVVSTAAAVDGAGDSDELQALFDAVVSEVELAEDVVSMRSAGVGAATQQAPAESDAVFNRIGQMTRQLHDTLRELGLNEALQQAANAVPDARQRLDYIAQMTEQAASRVLNATDIARPLQDRLLKASTGLHTRWDKAFAGELSPDEFRALSLETRAFLGQVASDSRTTNAQLMDIMMAQDFQDLTGQVIKRILHAAQLLESQLLQVLIESAPPTVNVERASSLMNGPIIDGKSRDDVVTSQEQVDDLLESLGF